MKRIARVLGWAGFGVVLAGAAGAVVYQLSLMYDGTPMLVVGTALGITFASSWALTWSDS